MNEKVCLKVLERVKEGEIVERKTYDEKGYVTSVQILFDRKIFNEHNEPDKGLLQKEYDLWADAEGSYYDYDDFLDDMATRVIGAWKEKDLERGERELLGLDFK